MPTFTKNVKVGHPPVQALGKSFVSPHFQSDVLVAF